MQTRFSRLEMRREHGAGPVAPSAATRQRPPGGWSGLRSHQADPRVRRPRNLGRLVSAGGPETTGRRGPGTTTGPLAAFAELGRVNLSDVDLDQLLAKVAQLAQEVMPAATAVSVTLVNDGLAATAAFTSDLAMTLDETQYSSGAGPCLDAAGDRGVRVVADMGQETRWPAYSSAAVAHGIGSSLSVGIRPWEGGNRAPQRYA